MPNFALHKINGFAVIAFKQSEVYPSDGLAILGVREAFGDFEYVTAVVYAVTDKEWNQGHYFQGQATLGNAFADYRKR